MANVLNKNAVNSVNGKRGNVIIPLSDSKTRVRVLNINLADLITPDKAGVIDYLNAKGFTKFKIETLIINVGEGFVTIELELSITSPVEGQVITEDLITSFEIANATGLKITSPVEGQIITGDLTTSFEII